MDQDQIITITREDLFRPEVDEALQQQEAIERQLDRQPVPEISLLRRVLLSNLFYIPFFGFLGALIAWLILEPNFSDSDIYENDVSITSAEVLFLPVLATLIVMFIFMGDSFVRRVVFDGMRRSILRGTIVFLGSFLIFIPVGLLTLLRDEIITDMLQGMIIRTMSDFPDDAFLVLVTWRILVLTIIGAMIGVGMYLGAGTRKQLESATLGGAVGGAFGGLMFEIIERFILNTAEEADVERFFLSIVLGICIGLFVALSEQLSRVGWFRVRTGPLAGKSFVLHRAMTTIGSAPQADIYLFKDPEIDPQQAVVYKLGADYEVEDVGSSNGTFVNGTQIRRRRLNSGDQVVVGDTILEFEERAKLRIKELRTKED